MTDATETTQPSAPKVAPETLELRARPKPVEQIKQKMLIGTAALVLLIIAALVLVALRPPSLRGNGAQELYNVEHKPVTDRLSALPAGYGNIPPKTPAVAVLKEPSADPVAEATRLRRATRRSAVPHGRRSGRCAARARP